ncbi:unnamed protein product [Ceratitis capitata]|uniref:(Mediterranean fruit fly) hypothetical protein n=1 Tax=Ceratitis capitata TaxID=7213 RepID=A0A811UEQ6_CERCA|nr:unnamed protein product [Ceratitis capitata]
MQQQQYSTITNINYNSEHQKSDNFNMMRFHGIPLNPESIQQHLDQVNLERVAYYAETEEDNRILNMNDVMSYYDCNYYNDKKDYLYHCYTLNNNQHVNDESHFTVQVLIRHLKRRTLQKISQRPMLLHIFSLFMWFHGKFWKFYYETLIRRLQ